MSYCENCKLRTKKGTKYFYCSLLRREITLDECQECENKSYKAQKPLKKSVLGVGQSNTHLSTKKPLKTNSGLKSKIQLKSKTPVKKVSKHHESVKDAVYDAVYNRCKGRCSLCGSTEAIQLHHIHGRGRNKTNDPNNCIMLCVDCHLIKVHGNQKKYRPILEQIVEDQLKDQAKESQN